MHGIAALPPLPIRPPILLNAPAARMRVNATQRPPCAPSEVLRLGHVALETRTFFANLLFWLRTFGLIVSDYQFLEDRPEFGPVMAFIRCDRGATRPTTTRWPWCWAPTTGYVHSAYELADLDAVAAGGEFLKERGYKRRLGHRPAHPGQPDLRLLARPRQRDGRALRRRRPVRRHGRGRLGADDGQRSRPVGPVGHPRLPRRHALAAPDPRRDRRAARRRERVRRPTPRSACSRWPPHEHEPRPLRRADGPAWGAVRGDRRRAAAAGVRRPSPTCSATARRWRGP